MALILNIETSTDLGSVCLSDKEVIIAVENSTKSFAHAEETTILINNCLKKAGVSLQDIAAVSISKGPGSYTALRVGTSIAKGICYALQKPLIAVNTLTSLALAASEIEKGDIYLPMIDARRMEVYTAFYDTSIHCMKAAHALILEENTFETALKEGKKLIFSGNGAQKVPNKNEQFIITDIQCHARHLAPLAYQAFQTNSFESVVYFEPFYLKPPNITTPKKVL